MIGQIVSEETILALEKQIDMCKENITELVNEFVNEADNMNEFIKNFRDVYKTEESKKYIDRLVDTEFDTEKVKNIVLTCNDIVYNHSKTLANNITEERYSNE